MSVIEVLLFSLNQVTLCNNHTHTHKISPPSPEKLEPKEKTCSIPDLAIKKNNLSKIAIKVGICKRISDATNREKPSLKKKKNLTIARNYAIEIPCLNSVIK